jgi:hypothetical protein
MEKIIRLGSGECGDVFCKIEIKEGELSISGVEGPRRNGDARGSCGQIRDVTVSEFAPGWDADLLARFLETWRAWHLNHMRAGCEHQRAEGWNTRPIDPSKPTDTYGKHFEGQKSDSWNMLAWVSRTEHPKGLLSHPCDKCGYKYGSAWLKEDLPQEAIDFLSGLPDTDKTPAWV